MCLKSKKTKTYNYVYNICPIIFYLITIKYYRSTTVKSYDVGFNPSTQRHYRRLIYNVEGIKTHIIPYHTRNRMQTPQINYCER
jgi:hypothetical protein